MNSSDDNEEFTSELDLDIDLGFSSTKKDGLEETELDLDFGSNDIVAMVSTIRDYLFKLQKHPNKYNLINSYPENTFFRCFYLLSDTFKQEDISLDLEDLLEVEHSLRLALKFVNNIMVNIISDNFNKNINLKHLFDLVDSNSNSYKTLLEFNFFLINNNGKIFPDSKSFISLFNFNYEKSTESLIALELSDVTWPLQWEISTIPVFDNLHQVLKSIFANLKKAIEVELINTSPNLLKLINGNFGLLTQILQVTKNLDNLVKMNNKVLAGLGKPHKTDDESKGFLFKSICEVFPILLQNIQQLNDAAMKDLKLKTVRRLASKIILVSKIDFYKSWLDGSSGLTCHMEMVKTIENWIENDKPKMNEMVDNDAKPLPIPKDNNYVDGKNKKAKRRAGVKLTKYRNRFKHTGKLDILQNRLAFGKEESFINGNDQYMDGKEDIGLGMAADSLTRLKKAKKTPNQTSKSSLKSKGKSKHKGKGKVLK